MDEIKLIKYFMIVIYFQIVFTNGMYIQVNFLDIVDILL